MTPWYRLDKCSISLSSFWILQIKWRHIYKHLFYSIYPKYSSWVSRKQPWKKYDWNSLSYTVNRASRRVCVLRKSRKSNRLQGVKPYVCSRKFQKKNRVAATVTFWSPCHSVNIITCDVNRVCLEINELWLNKN